MYLGDEISAYGRHLKNVQARRNKSLGTINTIMQILQKVFKLMMNLFIKSKTSLGISIAMQVKQLFSLVCIVSNFTLVFTLSQSI